MFNMYVPFVFLNIQEKRKKAVSSGETNIGVTGQSRYW